MKYNEVYASFTMNSEIAPRFELLNCFHPIRMRNLREDEERIYSYLKLVNHKSILENAIPNTYQEVAKLYLKNFLEVSHILNTSNSEFDFYNCLWRQVLKEVEPLQIGYIFNPSIQNQTSEVKFQLREFKRTFSDRIDNDVRCKGKITWTLPFPVGGDYCKELEKGVGVYSDLKSSISIAHYPSGFLSNYLLTNEKPIKNLLNSYQFEELVGIVYENEGWKVEKTKKTRDNGKDAIVTKIDEEGNKIIAYVEAKNPSKNKISVSQIREFYGVIRDDTDKGFFVTSSVFTEDARKWLNRKLSLAPVTLDLIDNEKLKTKLSRLITEDAMTYIKRIR